MEFTFWIIYSIFNSDLFVLAHFGASSLSHCIRIGLLVQLLLFPDNVSSFWVNPFPFRLALLSIIVIIIFREERKAQT